MQKLYDLFVVRVGNDCNIICSAIHSRFGGGGGLTLYDILGMCVFQRCQV